MFSDNASSLSLFVIIGVIALNRLALSSSALLKTRHVYWVVQIINVAAAVFVAVFGIPGFPSALKVLNYFVAFVFVFHLLENYQKHVALRTPARDWEAERRQLRDRINAQDPELGPIAPDPSWEPARDLEPPNGQDGPGTNGIESGASVGDSDRK